MHARKNKAASDSKNNSTSEVKTEYQEKRFESSHGEAATTKDPEASLDEIDLEDPDFDVFATEDVTDLGNGQPLFASWTFEDWVSLGLRFELVKLVEFFRKDVNDASRKMIHMDLLPFYYQKYYRKILVEKNYGVERLEDVIALVKDSVRVNPKTKVLESLLSTEFDRLDIFVRLTEEARRERTAHIDAGHTEWKLSLSKVGLMAPIMSGSMRQYSAGHQVGGHRDDSRSQQTHHRQQAQDGQNGQATYGSGGYAAAGEKALIARRNQWSTAGYHRSALQGRQPTRSAMYRGQQALECDGQQW